MEKINKLRFKPQILTALSLAGCVAFLTFWMPNYLWDNPMLNQDTLAHFTYTKKLIDADGFGNFVQTALHLLPDGGYYPPLFHILAMLIHAISSPFAALSVASSISAAWILTSGVVWPLGCLFFTRAVFPSISFAIRETNRHPLEFPLWAYFAVPIFSLLFPCFPYMNLESGTLYPYSLGSALLPWLLAFMFKLSRVPLSPEVSWKSTAWNISGVAVSFTLILLAQPRVLFTAALILLPYLIWWLIQIAKIYKRGSLKFFIPLGAVFAAGVSLVAVYVALRMKSDLLFHPERWFSDHGTDMTASEALRSDLLFESRIPPNIETAGVSGLLLGLIVWAVIVILLLNRKSNSLRNLGGVYVWIASLAVCQFALFCCQAGSGYLNIIAAPWYKEFIRLGHCLPLLFCLLATVALAVIVELFREYLPLNTSATGRTFSWKHYFYPTVICALSVVLAFLPLQKTAEFIRSENNLTNNTYLESSDEGADSERGPALLTWRKLEALRDVAETTDDDSLIVDDPYNGSGYLYSMFNRTVLFDTMNPKYGQIPRQWMVIDGFRELREPEDAFKNLICKSPQLNRGGTQNMFLLDLGDSYTKKFNIYKQYLPLHNKSVISKFRTLGFLSPVNSFSNKYAEEGWSLDKFNCAE